MPSILDSIGGLSGGLGGSGGVGGSIPSNQSAAHSAANSTVNPNVTLGSGAGSSGDFSQGGFSVFFPGAEQLPPGAINAPAWSTSMGIGSSSIPMIAIGLMFLVFVFLYRR